MSKQKKQIKRPTLEEVLEYKKQRNSDADAVKFWEYYEANEWHDSNNKPIVNWKMKWIAVWEKKPSQLHKKVEVIIKQKNDFEKTMLREGQYYREKDAETLKRFMTNNAFTPIQKRVIAYILKEKTANERR